ncbi:MAG TPA: CAP domain-containing protein [Pseudonocardiaceae bacterium]|nr:CAP domain-containing protein [Pseudonocardiaceae bacterium]
MTKNVWRRGVALAVFVVGANSGFFLASSATAAIGGGTSVDRAFTMINQERVKAGCASLRLVPQLQGPAGRQSGDQAARNRIGHDGANGSKPADRIGGLGYSRWAENIAQFQSADAAVNFWTTSPAHRASMLNCAFRDTGLAVAPSDSGRLYWTQDFGA